MSRKRSDQVGAHDSRDALWAAMRTLGEFTIPEVREHTRLGYDTTRDYVAGLTTAGYLAPVAERPAPGGRVSYVYRLVRDVGVEAPRVRKDGTEVTQGRAREQMWRTMKVLGEFSVKDLAVHATTEDQAVSAVDAQSYVRYLEKAGYLARRGGRSPRYLFLRSRDTGPKPPQVQRVRQVYDPNLGRVVWPEGADR